MDLGEKIQKYRKKSKLSQEQLGELVGVTRQTISNWELGESHPDIIEANELAQIFDISLDELVGNPLEDKLLKTTTQAKTISELSLGISIIHFLLFLFLIIVAIFLIHNVYKTEPVTQGVEINCKINENSYYYRVNTNYKTKEIISLETNDNELKQYLNMIKKRIMKMF